MTQPPVDNDAVSSLWMYRSLSRFHRLSYSGKIMMVAFAGTHIPLIGLITYFALTTAPDTGYALKMIAVALLATLIGTAVMLFVLHHLLRPIVLTSRALRNYIVDRKAPELPSGFHDTAGTLMADADYTLKRLEETIDHLKHYDSVTVLPNRAHFMRLLSERMEVREQMPFAVCAVKIERLDDIAATFGQEQFDNVLRQCVQRLEARLDRPGDLSRIDTRTFAFVLESDDLVAISATLKSLDRNLGGISYEGVDFRLDCRSGISLFPLDGSDAQTLLDEAMTALDSAIRENVRVIFFSSSSRDALLERHALENDLRKALVSDNELRLHYQPVVDADGDTIIGAEALIRWQHPTRGMILPLAFISLAEESDLIEHIGRWTLRTACRQLASWRHQDIHGLKVAVNLSARQFNDPTLLDYVAETLKKYAIDPGSLEIELTETSAMKDAVHSSAIMHQMRKLGVSIAIDDFGTGYSSMSYLCAMPFSKLKIDREFVHDIAVNAERQAICRALIALARELKLEVLAEGVETSGELAMLRSQGCSMFQGFYFSQPMPASEFEAMVNRVATPLESASTSIPPEFIS